MLWVTSEQIYAPGLARWQEGTFLLLTDGVLCKYDRARGGSSPRAWLPVTSAFPTGSWAGLLGDRPRAWRGLQCPLWVPTEVAPAACRVLS